MTSDLMKMKELEESKREKQDKEQWLQREGMEEWGGGGRRGDGWVVVDWLQGQMAASW